MEIKREMKLPDYAIEGELESRLGENGTFLLEKKYLPRDEDGTLTETPTQRFAVVSREVAAVEKLYGASDSRAEELARKFFQMISRLDFLPGGRVLANVGTDLKALANCYVLPVPDSLDGIYSVVHEAALVHKNGGGTGYNFSQLRPRGSRVKHGVASGPVSFGGQFDKETQIINSGNRRGANMGILNVCHPDIFEFIGAKFEEGQLQNFNVSIGITDEFMEAFRQGKHYQLSFNDKPFTISDLERITSNLEREKAGADVGKSAMPPSLRVSNGIVYYVHPQVDKFKRVVCDSDGRVLTKEEEVGKLGQGGEILIDAQKTLSIIARYAHASGEPGMIFLDTMDRDNLLRADGRLDTTNPCGEQPLHPYDACNLGSINLANMVGANGVIDFRRLEDVTRTAVRFMDNINDLNEGPIEKIAQTMRDHRRIGLGVMGWADMLMMLKIPYDSKPALDLADKVMGSINRWALEESVELAKEKGTFPAFERSDYPKNDPSQRVRNLARTTIAPTGSISMVAGVNGGIEPFFALSYSKSMRGGDKIQVAVPYFENALRQAGYSDAKIKDILERVGKHNGSCQSISFLPLELRQAFRVAHDIEPSGHIAMQAAFQRRVDNAISKTINLPHSATVEDIVEAYDLAHSSGCKGITVFRDGSRNVQVLNTAVVESGRPQLLGTTVEQTTPHGKAFITLNVKKGDPTIPYEAFINIGRGRADIGAISEGFGRLLSLAFKRGIPVSDIIDQLRDIPGETQVGFGNDRICSLPDAISKALGLAYGQLNNGEGVEEDTPSPEKKQSGNFCPKCGSVLLAGEGCFKCSKCDYSRC